MTPETASRLADTGIQLAAESPEFRVFQRGACVALVKAAGAAGAAIGSTGMMTESGLAFLIWREGRPFLAAKGRETPAGIGQVEEIQQFASDLKRALGG